MDELIEETYADNDLKLKAVFILIDDSTKSFLPL